MPPEVVNIRRCDPAWGTLPGDVLIDRTTVWGNPFFKGLDGSLAMVLVRYGRYVVDCEDLMAALPLLGCAGRLGCHCVPAPCHGHVLVELMERL